MFFHLFLKSDMKSRQHNPNKRPTFPEIFAKLTLIEEGPPKKGTINRSQTAHREVTNSNPGKFMSYSQDAPDSSGKAPMKDSKELQKKGTSMF